MALAVPARDSMNLRERPSVSSSFRLRFQSVISAACAGVTGTELAWMCRCTSQVVNPTMAPASATWNALFSPLGPLMPKWRRGAPR